MFLGERLQVRAESDQQRGVRDGGGCEQVRDNEAANGEGGCGDQAGVLGEYQRGEGGHQGGCCGRGAGCGGRETGSVAELFAFLKGRMHLEGIIQAVLIVAAEG